MRLKALVLLAAGLGAGVHAWGHHSHGNIYVAETGDGRRVQRFKRVTTDRA